MQSSENPFAAPQASSVLDLSDAERLPLNGFLSQEATQALGGTRPWVWIVGAILFATGVVGMIAAIVRLDRGLFQNWTGLAGNLMSAACYLLVGGMLVRYGRRIGGHLKQRTGTSLFAAIDAQRLFFQVAAMVTIGWILLMLALAVYAIMAIALEY